MKKTLIALGIVLAIGLAVVSLFISRRWTVDRLIIGKATTHITTPLNAEGYPDYAAALNAEASLGVTPENNAVVLLLQAFEPGEIDDEIKAEYYSALGIPPIEVNARKYESWSEFCARTKKWDPDNNPEQAKLGRSEWDEENYDRFEQALNGPWSREQLPDVAQWLDEQQPALSLAVAASQRSRYYAPMIIPNSDGCLVTVPLPLVTKQRELALSLRARAMRSLAENDLDSAWDDLQAVRRLGRLTGQEPFLISHLVGIAIEEIAGEAQSILIEHALPTDEQRGRWKSDLIAIGAPARMATRCLDQGERFFYLDAICYIAQGKPIGDPFGNAEAAARMNPFVDWNVPLQIVNEWVDRAVMAASIVDPKQRNAALDQLDRDLDALKLDREERLSIWTLVSQRELSKAVGQNLVRLFFPPIRAVINAESRCLMHYDLSLIALALAEYKVQHGVYPDDLTKLVPDSLSKIPVDHFTGAALVYQRTENGYKLYSLGPDGKDAGGDDSYSSEAADDVAVNVPFKKPKTLAERKADEAAAMAAATSDEAPPDAAADTPLDEQPAAKP